MGKCVIVFKITCFVTLLLQGCISTVGPEPEEKETYTWQGTLYKGLGETPWPNADLTLIGAENVGAGKKYHTLATGKTDENGHFMLQYEWERDWHQAGEGQVDLEVNGSYPIMWAPWNVNVDRDLCENDHSSMVLKIENLAATQNSDTLFIYSVFQPNSILEGTVQFVQFLTSVGIIERFMILNPIQDTTINFKFGFSGSYDSKPREAFLNYAIGKKNMDKIFAGYYSEDDDSEKENLVEYSIRSFPYVDSVMITITD